MKNPTLLIGYFVLVSVLLLYLFGIYSGIFLASADYKNQDMPRFSEITGYSIFPPLDFFVNALNTTLLINLGAVLTASVSKEEFARIARATLSPVPQLPKPKHREIMQLLAALVVLIGGLACFIAWIAHSREKIPNLAPFVSINGKSLVGVLIGYVGYLLGTKPTVQGFSRSLFK